MALNLQQAFRRRQAHAMLKELRLRNTASIKCQRLWRGHASRKQTLVKLSSIILIQATMRSRINSRQYLAARNAATCLQRIWRGFWAELQYQIDLLDIVSVQSVIRRRLAFKQREGSLRAVVMMQVAARGYLARCLFLRKRRAAEALLQGHESATICQVREVCARPSIRQGRDSRLLK